MRWQDAERSTNVDDVRGRRFGGGGMPMRLGWREPRRPRRHHGDHLPARRRSAGGAHGRRADRNSGAWAGRQRTHRRRRQPVRPGGAEEHRDGLGHGVPRALGRSYAEPKLVCSATGPAVGVRLRLVGGRAVLLPARSAVYIDLSFFTELDRRFGAPGDFAQAYVIAHEVGHHVQNLLGIAEKVRAAQQRAGEAQANQLSVRMELQADCLAGVWGHDVKAQSGPGKVTSSRATSRKGCAPPPRSATTRSSASAGPGVARELDARLVGAARAVAAPRPRERPGQRLQHSRDVVVLSGSALSRAHAGRGRQQGLGRPLV